jgi:hypothetical protein
MAEAKSKKGAKPKGDTARVVALEDLKPYPGNANVGDVDGIMESLEANTQYRPIVVNAGGEESHMTILAGNHTAEAALRLGWKKIRVWFVDVDYDMARRINLADNRWPERGAGARRAARGREGVRGGPGRDRLFRRRRRANAPRPGRRRQRRRPARIAGGVPAGQP